MTKPFSQPGDIKRVALFWLYYFAALAACLFIFVQFLPKNLWWYGWGLSAASAAIMLTRYFIKKEADQAEFTWLTADKFTAFRFLAGLAVGIMIITAIVLILTKSLHLHIVRDDTSFPKFLLASLALIPCAFQEELGFRYYTLKKLNRRLSPWKTQLIIAGVFALYHIVGGQDIMNAIFSTTLWSVVYSLAAMLGNGLALPVGIHAGSTMMQAFFGLKLQEGFSSFYKLVPVDTIHRNAQLIVLITQTMVLIIAIIVMLLVQYFIKRKKIQPLS